MAGLCAMLQAERTNSTVVERIRDTNEQSEFTVVQNFSSALRMIPRPSRIFLTSPLREEVKNHDTTTDFIAKRCNKHKKVEVGQIQKIRTYLFSIVNLQFRALKLSEKRVRPRHFTHCLRRLSADVRRRKSRAFEPEVNYTRNTKNR